MAFLASAVLHVAIIALYPLFVLEPSGVARPISDPVVDPVLDGTEIVQLAEFDDVDPPDEPAPEPEVFEEPPETRIVELPPPETEDEDEDESDVGDDLTIAERLQPRMVDPRLWAPVDRSYLDLTDGERAQLLVAGMIRTYNDSVAVAVALAEEAVDWTYTDDEGRRWGLSYGRLHLGDFSIPLPLFETPPADNIEDQIEDAWVLSDLARGAEAAAIRDTWSNRARAIRERLEAERLTGNGGGGPRAAPEGRSGGSGGSP